MNEHWALHNTLKGWTFYDLSIREVQLLVQGMSSNEVRLAKICLKNASQWMALSPKEHSQFFHKESFSSEGYPLLASDRGTTTYTGTEIDTDYFVVKKRIELPRLHTRYDVCIPCIIFSTKKNFETETVNISEGGLQFKDLLPEWTAGYFIVGVRTSEGLIQLMCSLVEDQKEKRRVQIVSEDSDVQYILYKHWLSTLSSQVS